MSESLAWMMPNFRTVAQGPGYAEVQNPGTNASPIAATIGIGGGVK
jgi:hypothetical protein